MKDYFMNIPLYIEGIDNSILLLLIKIFFLFLMFIFLLLVFRAIYNWVLFKKIGREGWESIIPIYNKIIMIQTLEIPTWMIVLLFVPPFVLIVNVFIAINIAKKFDKDIGFMIGLILLPIIFYPILAFGKPEFHSEVSGIFDDNEKINNGYCVNCGSKVYGRYCQNCGSSTKL